ncbi:hypothetical protein KEJ87_13225 [Enterococcus faecium]|nr:hypothetical protein [Enterococcus faecium]
MSEERIYIPKKGDIVWIDFDKIVLIEALLFLSMIPLHGESFDHQIVMLATGMELLARVSNKVIL